MGCSRLSKKAQAGQVVLGEWALWPRGIGKMGPGSPKKGKIVGDFS